MPSPFAAALAAAEPIFDAQIGEAIRVVPMAAGGDFGRRADSARPAFDVVGLSNYVDPSTSDIGSMNARVRYEETEVEIRWPLLAGRTIRVGDEVVLDERPMKPRFKVGRRDDADPERLVLVLVRLAGDRNDVPGP